MLCKLGAAWGVDELVVVQVANHNHGTVAISVNLQVPKEENTHKKEVRHPAKRRNPFQTGRGSIR